MKRVNCQTGLQILLFIFFFLTISANNVLTAQSLSVNTSGAAAHASAMMDVNSSNKGILIPRVALTASNDAVTISSPATSLLVYNTSTMADVVPGYYYWNGTAWTRLFNGAAWSLTGNTGTSPVSNFLGTTDNAPLIFKVNNQLAGMIDATSNVFLGTLAGSSNISTRNTAIGFNAMQYTSAGSDNVAVGHFAMVAATTGFFNTAVGSSSMMLGTAGSFNTAMGFNSLSHNTGYGNTVVGADAMINNGAGTDNVSIGYQSLKGNTTGDKNVAVGRDALLLNTSGYENTAVGFQAMYNNNSGIRNVAMGSGALYNSNSNDNIAIGNSPLFNNSGNNNIALGNYAMSGFNNGDYNMAMGYQALGNNSGGNGNLAIGYASMSGNTLGRYNTALGYQALNTNTTGNYNVAIGYQSMSTVAVTTGDENISIGSHAGAFNTGGSYNTLIGYGADVNSTVSNATAIGANAKVQVSNSVVLGAPGYYVGIGLPNPANLLHVYGFGNEQVTIENPFPGNTTGILYRSGGNDMARIDHTGSYLRIEDYSPGSGWGGISINQGKVGINTSGPTANLSVNGTADNATGTWGVFSDERIKSVDHSFTDGLNVIRHINPVIFHYNSKAPYPVAEAQVGVVAQELERIAPYMVSRRPFNSFSDLREVNNQAYVFLLINAVKEQENKIEKLEQEIEALKALIKR